MLRAAAAVPPVALAFYAAFLVYIVFKYVAVAQWPLDDAFFFVRYAENFLETGSFSWNKGGPPVYGNTSQIYQFVVTAVYWLSGRNAVQTLIALGVSGLWAAAAATLWAYFHVNTAADRPRWIVATVGALLALLLVLDRTALIHALYAMETTWATAFVALAVAAAQSLLRAPGSWRSRTVAGAMIVVVFAVRPDAALIPVALLGGLILWGDRAVRRGSLVAAGGGFIALALYIFACWLYYGSALPLAANIKIYGLTEVPANPLRFYVENLNLLGMIVINNQVPTILALACVADWRAMSPVLRGAVIGLLVFCAYHLLFTFHITASYGRYFFPIVPLLFILAGSLCVRMIGAIIVVTDANRRVSWLRVGAVAALVLLAMQLTLFFIRVEPLFQDLVRSQPAADDAVRALNINADAFSFFGGDMTKLAGALDAGCSIASTEDGVLSAVYKGPIVDLSGLHDPQIAYQGFSADRVFAVQRPDVLVMPHPALYKWSQALGGHPAFLRDYDVHHPSATLRLWVDIGFRKDSACAQKAMRTLYGASP